MMLKKNYMLLIIISIFILSCSSPSDPNNDNNNESEYKANGIPATYDGTWKFYNVDNTGNTAIDVTISGGSISGLVISNKSGSKQNFDKSKIYSEEGNYKNIYYGGYKGYIVSDGNWIGEIQLPAQSSTGVGYVSIKNNSTQELIEGILDHNSGITRGENSSTVKDIKGTWINGAKELVIDQQFITYSDNGQQIFKIPFMFFTSFSGYEGTGYSIQGLLYDGVNINTTAVTTPGDIKFQYIENNHHLTIKIGADGVPTKVEWTENQPTTVVSATEFTKQS
ncbi:hypothetical protein [Brachyspira pilosicoli]|uniref:hypothetical protein n=1 Tax=Brachyspira pilosicoli TaxID=52584 RepID=UPI001CA4DE3C|nr:hypothetical protein [Brachyspira pilosicoli]MBW5397356.1 hypothetical protein [Brachyspira pilosicoli]